MEQFLNEIGLPASFVVGLYILVKYLIEQIIQFLKDRDKHNNELLERLTSSIENTGKGLLEVSMHLGNIGERVGKIEEDVQDIKEVIRVEDMLNKSKKETTN